MAKGLYMLVHNVAFISFRNTSSWREISLVDKTCGAWAINLINTKTHSFSMSRAENPLSILFPFENILKLSKALKIYYF